MSSHPSRAHRWRAAASVAAIGLLAAACGSSGSGASAGSSGGGLTASAPGITASTITLGSISSLTGIAASTFSGKEGALVRIDQQNAAGGVDGRKLVLDAADDQSNPPQENTAAQLLVGQDNVFGVIEFSAAAFAAAAYLNKQGVPVTGSEIDGPEWGQQPYSNMFTYTPPLFTPYGGKTYSYYAGAITFLKRLGVTRLAAMAPSASPSATMATTGFEAAAQQQGMKKCYLNNSLAITQVDFTAQVLAIKNAHCNGVILFDNDSADASLSTSLKQAGVTAVQLYPSGGYDDAVLASKTATTALDGDYFESAENFSDPNPATTAMIKSFKKYDPGFKGGIPEEGDLGSYIAADLMIRGLQAAGKNPTRASFIAALRKVTNYTAGGILPSPTTFAGFGTPAMFSPQDCTYVMQLKNGSYVTANGGKPVCGKLQS